ncbi:MAG: alpha/beta fold hydrolase [Defluviitaleaceae bacterium]|nr:alpha/beta fold hydrolase [Defluviitaleaceae bacterium]
MKQFAKKSTAILMAIILFLPLLSVYAVTDTPTLPIRDTFEAAGGTVAWDSENRRITATLAENTYVFYPNSARAYVNGEAFTLLNNVFIEDDRAFIHGADLENLLSQVAEATVQSGFASLPVVVGEGTAFPLDGILAMPADATGPVPGVVIVHGSGPSDMDGTLFENTPLRDIAEYLAANGIATIRYNKRTYSHGAALPEGFTVWEETMEDAILAAEILRAHPDIDSDRVFIIGHSLGGMLAPRIHGEGGNFAGLILLGGSPRFLPDISLTQSILTLEATAALMPEGAEKDELLATIQVLPDIWHEQFGAVLALPDEVTKVTPLPEFGVFAYYYVDLYRHPVADFLESALVPMLVLQAGNDMQILTDIDFALYQELLAGRTDVTFKLYEGLNHLFMPSTKTNILELMDEYAIPSHVDAQVLADIAAWILAQS